MFDSNIRRHIDPWLDRIAAFLVTCRIQADFITIAGFLVGMAGCVAIAFECYRTALILIALNRFSDGLDGAIARRTQTSDLGGYLDIVLDMIFYSGVPFGFAIARPDFTLPAAFLTYSFVGTGCSFLAYAIIAAKRGTTGDKVKKKTFYYSSGMMEGAETIVCFVLMCLFPDSFSAIAWSFGGLCWLTTALRIAAAVGAFREPRPEKAN